MQREYLKAFEQLDKALDKPEDHSRLDLYKIHNNAFTKMLNLASGLEQGDSEYNKMDYTMSISTMLRLESKI